MEVGGQLEIRMEEGGGGRRKTHPSSLIQLRGGMVSVMLGYSKAADDSNSWSQGRNWRFEKREIDITVGGGAPCPKIFEIGLLNDAISGHQNAKY